MRATCVIFDVDGTLVDSNSFDDDLFGRAVREVLGEVPIRPHWSDYEHVTDSGILREICRENRLDLRVHEEAVRRRFGELIASYLSQPDSCLPIGGGLALFEALRRHPGVHVGIATGGWTHTALMKLKAARYEVQGVVLASADDAFARTEILECARARLPRSEKVVYVGDGEWDRRACEVLGWLFVGIGERLRGRCTHWMSDFSSDRVLRALIEH